MKFVNHDRRMDEGSSNNTIGMDEWVSVLERKLSYYVALRQTVRPIYRCLIGRVPQKILDLDRNAYEPISLSIGPYHHGNPALQRTYEKLTVMHTSDKRNLGKKIQSSWFMGGVHRLFRWRRAEQYHEAGVHFRKRVFTENDRHSLLDIRFTNGLTEVPPLFIDGNTGSFFRNIIALEQTCPQYGNYFTSYCAFLSQVVTQPADVTLLAKRGILVHHMRTDEEVSTLLTRLGKNVYFDINGDHYLKSLCRRMEEHYQSRVNRCTNQLFGINQDRH
ncbi:hypothetical protein EJB05_15676, partial [Eragrostis curvula]